MACIIAEQTREEPGGKSTILGFLGLSPSVVIAVRKMPALIQLSALLICKADAVGGLFDVDVMISGPEGVILNQTRATLPQVQPGKQIAFAFNFQGMPVALPGKYKISIFSDGDLHSEHFFSVSSTED